MVSSVLFELLNGALRLQYRKAILMVLAWLCPHKGLVKGGEDLQ